MADLRLHQGPQPVLPRPGRSHVLPSASSGSATATNSSSSRRSSTASGSSNSGDNGNLLAIDKRTGHQIWRRRLGRLSASTPAVTSNTVYATVLASGHARTPGRLVALNSSNGGHPLVSQPPQPQRVLAPARSRQDLLRLPERHRLRPQRQDRSPDLDLPRSRRRQGQPDPLRRPPLLRRLLGPRPGDLRADRTADLAQRLRRDAAGKRHLLLDRSGLLRAGLPG